MGFPDESQEQVSDGFEYNSIANQNEDMMIYCPAVCSQSVGSEKLFCGDVLDHL